MSGMEIWNAAMHFHVPGISRDLMVRHCFYALNIMLKEAEMVSVKGDVADSVGKIREVQAHLEKVVRIMTVVGECQSPPQAANRLKLVVTSTFGR